MVAQPPEPIQPQEAAPMALEDACMALTSPSPVTRGRAEDRLLRAGHGAVPVLVRALESCTRTSAHLIPRVALILGALRARAALPALCALVLDDMLEGDARAVVARALVELLERRDRGDHRCIAAVERLAADGSADVRAWAARALGALGDERSRACLEALCLDADPWVRACAGAVWTHLAEEPHDDASDGAPDDAPDDAPRSESSAQPPGGAEHNGVIGRRCVADLADLRRSVRDAAIAQLVRARRTALPGLLAALHHPLPRARISAALALGRLRAPDAAGPLLVAATASASTHEERELRATALHALIGCLTGDERGLAPSLRALARDSDRFVRAAAIRCLGRLDDEAGLAAVIDALGDRDPLIVEGAAVALAGGTRPRDQMLMAPLLAALTQRPPPPTAAREAILTALSRMTIDDARLRVRLRHCVRHELSDASADKAHTRALALALLERLYGDADLPPLPLLDDALARLGDCHPSVRLAAASFLRAHLPTGMSGALGPIAQALSCGDDAMCLLLLEALPRHGTEEAKNVLEQALTRGALKDRAAALLLGFSPTSTIWAGAAPGVPEAPQISSGP